MFSVIREIVDGHLKSFSNTPGGYSGKKLSAFYLILLVIVLQTLYIKWSYDNSTDIKAWVYVPELVAIDLAGALAALGINGWEKIKGNKKTDETDNNNSPNPIGG